MRFIKRLLVALFLVALVPAGSIAIFCWQGGDDSVERLPDIASMAAPVRRFDVDAVGYRRNEAQTWLNLPRWYVVFSARSFADFVQEHSPTEFPYFSAVGQFWTAYCQMHHLTKDRYEVPLAVHADNLIRGTSYTVRYVLRGVYENTVGRLTEYLGGVDTVEDRHARLVAQEYADFIARAPWYEFPFFGKISGLWTRIDFSEPDVFRRIERRMALTVIYVLHGIAGWLVDIATGLTVGPADQTMLVVDLEERRPGANVHVQLLKPLGEGNQLLAIGDDAAFSSIVLALVRGGAVVREIAGNDEILMTVVAPRDWTSQSLNAVRLFSQPILTDPDNHRVALWVRVAALHDVVRSLDGGGVVIERLYDY